MQHSIKYIGDKHERFSEMRKDKIRFRSEDFFDFASNNQSKYGIIEEKDDLIVSTFHIDALVNDFKETIKE